MLNVASVNDSASPSASRTSCRTLIRMIAWDRDEASFQGVGATCRVLPSAFKVGREHVEVEERSSRQHY